MSGMARSRAAGAALALALVPLSVTACGSSDNKKSSSTAKSTAPSTLSIKTTDLGKKKFKMEAPKSIAGGVVNVSFSNAGKVPHSAQLIRMDSGHTVAEVLKIVAADQPVIPDWMHGEGGVSVQPPGATGTATVKLAAGEYSIVDLASESGPPQAAFGARATFKVAGDNGGEIKDTAAKVEAKDVGKDKYEWVASNLKAGTNDLTFENTSKEDHLLVAAPIRANATLADVKKDLTQQGKRSGPPPVDFTKATGAVILSTKRKETTRVTLSKGHYALICFIPDRDGKGKPHFLEGMLKEVEVK